MHERRLEEILEECLAAYLEGRRSIEESLSLYPSLADRLEPLLRTAVVISENLERYSPTAGSMERRRARFLQQAEERRRLVREDRPMPFHYRRRWALLGGLAAAVAVGGVIAAGTLTGGGGERSTLVFFEPATPSPRAQANSVETLYSRINTLTIRANRGESIEGTDIASLNAIAARIDQSEALDEESRQDLQAAAEAFVQSVAQSPEQPAEVTAGLLALTAQLERLGVVISSDTAPSSPTASPSPTPTEAAGTPPVSGSPTSTPAATTPAPPPATTAP